MPARAVSACTSVRCLRFRKSGTLRRFRARQTRRASGLTPPCARRHETLPAPTRLCLAVGPWQLLLLGAALRSAQAGREQETEDHLVLYEPLGVSTDFRTTALAIASSIWSWRSIRW